MNAGSCWILKKGPLAPPGALELKCASNVLANLDCIMQLHFAWSFHKNKTTFLHFAHSTHVNFDQLIFQSYIVSNSDYVLFWFAWPPLVSILNMAKSLRSKRKRKVRAEKRIVNAKKELVKLKEVAARLHGTTQDSEKKITKASIAAAGIPDVCVNETPMLVDGDTGSSKKALTKINNQWMNQRKIKAIKSKIKRANKKKSRRGGSAGMSSRKTKKSLRK